jgi:hypothetical protein
MFYIQNTLYKILSNICNSYLSSNGSYISSNGSYISYNGSYKSYNGSYISYNHRTERANIYFAWPPCWYLYYPTISPQDCFTFFRRFAITPKLGVPHCGLNVVSIVSITSSKVKISVTVHSRGVTFIQKFAKKKSLIG